MTKTINQVSGYSQECKKFTKHVHKVNDIVCDVVRVYKDGSGIEYEHKRCGVCGLKYKGAKLKVDYSRTIVWSCPVCKA